MNDILIGAFIIAMFVVAIVSAVVGIVFVAYAATRAVALAWFKTKLQFTTKEANDAKRL